MIYTHGGPAVLRARGKLASAARGEDPFSSTRPEALSVSGSHDKPERCRSYETRYLISQAFGWSVDEVLSAFKNLEAPPFARIR